MISILAAILMVLYPLVNTLITTQGGVNNLSSGRSFVLFMLFCAGIAALAGAILKKKWWPLYASTLSFCVSLFAFPVASSVEVTSYAALALGLLVFTSRTPPSESISDSVRRINRDGSQEAEEAMPTQEDLEFLKYKLERDRYHWEKASKEAESTILNRHFGVIITGIISIAAITVSFAQLSISSNNARTQIDYEKIKNDRQFYLEAARFLLTFERDLKTQDVERIAYFRDVVVSSFPPDLAMQVATTMKDTSRTPAASKIWEDGLRYLRSKDARQPAR